MKKKVSKTWMVRAGEGNFLIDEFINSNIVAIGWNELGSLPASLSKQELKKKLWTEYPDWSAGAINQSAGQIWRFFNEFNIGDNVITYDVKARVYYVGEIKSDYIFSDKKAYHHFRNVDWELPAISRDELTVDSKNTLGSVLTIFEIPISVWDDIFEAHPAMFSDDEFDEMMKVQEEFEVIELQQLKEEVISKSTEFIKDLVSSLTWVQAEVLVAGVLRGMGYKTRMTSRGGDLGHDIIASPDGLEMVDPIIKAEVKHKTKSKDKVGAPEIRNFVGGLRTNTKGIYVSATGFSKEAFYEAERANFQITLIDLDHLVQLITEYYEDLDLETKALVPLKKIYWPV